MKAIFVTEHSLKQDQYNEYQTCVALIKAPSNTKVENPTIEQYIKAMEDIPDQRYKCLRKLWEVGANGEDTSQKWHVPINGYCG